MKRSSARTIFQPADSDSYRDLLEHLQLLERVVRAEERQAPTVASVEELIATRQADWLAFKVIKGDLQTWATDRGAEQSARRWLLELKAQADGAAAHSDAAALLFCDRVIEAVRVLGPAYQAFKAA